MRTSTDTQTDVTCYGLVRGRGWQQEHYESASRDAGRRARQLRRLGLRVWVSALGPQVTPVGRVRMSTVNVRFEGEASIPAPTVVRL